MSFQIDIYQIADELRAAANQGLHYATNIYDRERCKNMLSISARLVSTLENKTSDEVMEDYLDNMSHFSPILAADAAVFKEDSILLIKRQDNGLWAMPGGLVNVGESWSDGCIRELYEEAGVKGDIVRLLGLFDSRRWGCRRRLQLYSAVFEVSIDSSKPSPGPEASDVRFYKESELPKLSPGHVDRVPFLFQIRSNEANVPYYDEATFSSD